MPDIKAGDAIFVAYHHGDVAQDGIRDLEDGKFVHVICCLGGNEIIEADVQNVAWSDLRNYTQRGDCDLLLRRLPLLSHAGSMVMKDYWKGRVGEHYNFVGCAILGVALILRALRLHLLTKAVLNAFPRLTKNRHQVECSQLWVRGAQHALAFSHRFDVNDFIPEVLANDPRLMNVARFNGARWEAA